MKKSAFFALAPIATAVVLAGCGGNYSSGAKASATTAAAHTGPAVALRPSKLGSILTDGHGRTLYLFEADKGTASACYSACASVWPPLTTAHKPTAGKHVVAGKLGTTKRRDGKTEVTYNGHPLYYYAGDRKPGDITGQGVNQFGAKWYVLARTGKKIDTN
jgi:predicted lipoprotein with Yx(FWY)xxD motif